MLECSAVARRPEREKADILSEEDLKELRYNLPHLSEPAVRDFYERWGFKAVRFGDGSGNEEKCPDVLYEWRP